MDTSSRPFNTVMIRRGAKVARGIPARKLVAYIQEKKLLPTDEISGDGRRWTRIDQVRHLARYFNGDPKSEMVADPASIFPQEKEITVSRWSENFLSRGLSSTPPSRPPGVENELARLAKMLEDINK